MKPTFATYNKEFYKKIIFALSMFIFTSVSVFANPNSGYDITNKVQIHNDGVRTGPAYPDPQKPLKSSYMYGNKNFPLVGLTTYGPIFLDKKSCTFEVIDNVGYLACIVYYGGGGADGLGNAAKHTPVTMRFCTWKPSKKRVIKFLSSVGTTGKNDAENDYNSDDGFLNGLFWYASGCLGISQYLD